MAKPFSYVVPPLGSKIAAIEAKHKVYAGIKKPLDRMKAIYKDAEEMTTAQHHRQYINDAKAGVRSIHRSVVSDPPVKPKAPPKTTTDIPAAPKEQSEKFKEALAEQWQNAAKNVKKGKKQ